MPNYVLGLDPGQAHDPTALALVEYDDAEEPIYRIRGLHRFPLNTPYTHLPKAFEPRLGKEPLAKHTNLAVDATGVGAAVVDNFRDQLRATPLFAITITSGYTVTGDNRNPHVPKEDLISTTSVLLEQNRLRIAASMRHTQNLVDELIDYRRTTTPRGNETYAAASGKHDDLVLALSLALWTAENRRPPARRYRIGNPNRLGVNLPSVDDMLDQAHRQKFGW
jgi:hypothetical protein